MVREHHCVLCNKGAYMHEFSIKIKKKKIKRFIIFLVIEFFRFPYLNFLLGFCFKRDGNYPSLFFLL